MTKLLVRLLPMILSVVSPEIKQALVEFLDLMEERAKKTANPWDDMLVALLKRLVSA